MWTICFCFTVVSIFQIETYPQYEITYSNNGWIPITSDQVHRDHIPRDVIYNTYINTKQNEFVIETTTEKMVEEEVTTVNAYHDDGNNNRCEGKDPRTCNTNISDDLHLILQTGFLPNIFKLEEPKNKTLRRSKKILHDSFQNNNETNTKEIEANEKSYEVTEENILEDLEPKYEIEKGYFYNQPNDYTTNFLNLLSKYDIKSTDNLPNYALSLPHNAYKPDKQRLSLRSYGFQIPFRYNSLNHLPVDPLLAVFLSNYGYYLQGQYGIQNNYNNMYGYLASNNIHNNKPFGLYKIFADTDSSN